MFLLEKHDVSAFLFFPVKKKMFVWLGWIHATKRRLHMQSILLHEQKSWKALNYLSGTNYPHLLWS
jgi:hypothetical protein